MRKNLLQSKFLALILAPLIMGAAPCTTQLAELLSESDSSQVSDKDLVEAYKELFSSLPVAEIKSLSKALQNDKSWSEILRGDLKKAHVLKSFDQAYSEINKIRNKEEHHEILKSALNALLKTKSKNVQKKRKVKRSRGRTRDFWKIIFSQEPHSVGQITWSDDGKWIAFAGFSHHVTLVPAQDESLDVIKIDMPVEIPIEKDVIHRLHFLPNSYDLIGFSNKSIIYKFKNVAPGEWTSKSLGRIKMDQSASDLKVSPVSDRYTVTTFNQYAGLFERDNITPLNAAMAEKLYMRHDLDRSQVADSTFLANGEWRFVMVSFYEYKDYLDIRIYGEGDSHPSLLEAYRITDLKSLGRLNSENFKGVNFFADERKMFFDFNEDNPIFVLNLGAPPKSQDIVSLNSSHLEMIDDRKFNQSGMHMRNLPLSSDRKMIAVPGVKGKFYLIDMKTNKVLARGGVPKSDSSAYPSLQFSPDGKSLAVSNGRNLYLYDLETLLEEIEH